MARGAITWITKFMQVSPTLSCHHRLLPVFIATNLKAWSTFLKMEVTLTLSHLTKGQYHRLRSKQDRATLLYRGWNTRCRAWRVRSSCKSSPRVISWWTRWRFIRPCNNTSTTICQAIWMSSNKLNRVVCYIYPEMAQLRDSRCHLHNNSNPSQSFLRASHQLRETGERHATKVQNLKQETQLIGVKEISTLSSIRTVLDRLMMWLQQSRIVLPWLKRAKSIRLRARHERPRRHQVPYFKDASQSRQPARSRCQKMTKASQPIYLSQAKALRLSVFRLALMAIRETTATWSKVCIRIDTRSSHSLCSIQCTKPIVTRVRSWLTWCRYQGTKGEHPLKCSQAGTELKISVKTWIDWHLTKRACAFCKKNLSKKTRCSTHRLSMARPWSKEWAASKVIEWLSQIITTPWRKKKATSKV